MLLSVQWLIVFPSLCDVEKERVREETSIGNIATEGQIAMVY